MAKVAQLESLGWHPGFTDFRPVLIITKCHTENSSQISHLCRLFIWHYAFSRHRRFMTTNENRNKDRFKNWKLWVLWKLPFHRHGAIKLTQNCVYFTNPCINLLAPSSVTRDVNTTSRYLDFPTCCGVILLTCSIHCLGFLERHPIPVFLMLIFIPVRSHAAKNWSGVCWRPCWKDATASSTKSSAKIEWLILQLPTVKPSSTRL